MKEVRRKSPIPVYGMAVVWLVYSVFLPLYKTWHLVLFACLGAAAYAVLSKLFPGTTEYVELPKEPVSTGNPDIDALLTEGERAVSQMRSLSKSISGERAKKKLDEIIIVADKIFKNLLDDPDDYRKVKRFADFFLPATIKLLHAYDRFGASGIDGENITGTIKRIDEVLDTILESYKKFYDSLFENQALDIETDIMVLESMMKKEGFLGNDF